MKKLAIFLAIATALCGSAVSQVTACSSTSYGNGFTCVQAVNKTITTGTSTTQAYTSNVTANNTLIIWASSDCPLSSSSCNTESITISDSLSSSFATCPGVFQGQTSSGVLEGSIYCWYAKVPSSAADTVTFSSIASPGAASHMFELTEWSGVLTTGTALDQTGTAGHGTNGTQTVSTTGATTQAVELVCGHHFDWSSNVTFSAGTGYTRVTHVQDSTNGSADITQCKTVTSTGTQTSTVSGGSAGDAIANSIQTFKAAPAGTTCVPTLNTLGVSSCG